MPNENALLADYQLDGYFLKNYIHCSPEEHEKILETRNSDFVRLNSLNQSCFSIRAHMDFVDKLKNRKDVGYWMIYLNGKAFGCLFLSSEDGSAGLFKFRENTEEHVGRRIIRLACTLAFGELALKKLTATCFDNNPASWKSFEAEGFYLTEKTEMRSGLMRFYEKEAV